MYLPNEEEYHFIQGTIYRNNPKYKIISRKQLIKEKYEREHEHKLTKKEKRSFKNYLKRSK